MKPFSQQIDYSQPSNDCAEISVFGPGIGECLVLHLGNGEWFIVDSCLNPETNNPIAYDYLTSLNVGVDQVKGILITHWHADHTAGIAKLVKTYSNAGVYLPAALSQRYALQLAALFKKDRTSGDYESIREYSEVIDHVAASGLKGRLKPVLAGRAFFINHDLKMSLTALSPSDAAVTHSISQLTYLAEPSGRNRVRLEPKFDPNLNAVALHFSFGDFSALLGSDLETTGDSETGWSAVLSSGIYGQLGLSASSLYKVSHHGSETGHHDGIWTDLLNAMPISITTAFSRSRLPRARDVERIKGKSAIFGITKLARKSVPRDSVVEKEMNAVCSSRRVLNLEMGHIQIRIKVGLAPMVAGNENAVLHE